MKKVEAKKPAVRSTPLKVSSVALAKKLGLTNVVARSKPVTKPTAKKAKAQIAPPKPLPPRGGKKAAKARQDIASLEPLSDAISKAGTSTAKRRAKAVAIVNDEAPAKKPVDADAPHIECKLIVGDLALAIDASDLAHTLGSGRWGHGLGLVDQWPDAVWVGLLAHLKLPADPLDRAAAEQPVKRFVQRLWYEAIQGSVPEESKPTFDARDAAHAEEYKTAFTGVKSGAEGRSTRASTNFAKARGSESTYVPTALLKDKKLKLGGQQAPLLEFFKDTKFAPATLAQATAGIVKAGLKTAKQTPERVAAFYLSDWTKRGLLERNLLPGEA